MSERVLLKVLLALHFVALGLLIYIARESYLIYWNY